jgi:hypothetical protein
MHAIVGGLRENSDVYRKWSWSLAQDHTRDTSTYPVGVGYFSMELVAI